MVGSVVWILVKVISRMFLFFRSSEMISAKDLCFLACPAGPAPPAHAEVVLVGPDIGWLERLVDSLPPPGGGWPVSPITRLYDLVGSHWQLIEIDLKTG